MKRPAPLAGCDFLVGSFGLAQRRIVQDGQVGAQGRIQLMDTIETARVTATEVTSRLRSRAESSPSVRKHSVFSAISILFPPNTRFLSPPAHQLQLVVHDPRLVRGRNPGRGRRTTCDPNRTPGKGATTPRRMLLPKWRCQQFPILIPSIELCTR